jgi:hypothetical protein
MLKERGTQAAEDPSASLPPPEAIWTHRHTPCRWRLQLFFQPPEFQEKKEIEGKRKV